MTSQGPIEIKPEDLIRRPGNLPITTSGASKAANLKDQMKQWLDIAKQVDEFTGGKLKTKVGNLLGGQDKQEVRNEIQATQGNPAQGLLMILRSLQMAYGDLTVNELLDRLKKDYGEYRISQITGQRK